MKEDKTTMTVTENSEVIDEQHPVVANEEKNKSNESGTSLQLLKLAKQFAIDGALLPVEKQMPIEERTSKRNRLNDFRRQQNIEQVMQKTLHYCANLEAKLKTDGDWFSRYIQLAEDVSNPTMQDLWAKILAGELSKPGSFSFKALKVFKDMSIFDAKLLAKACSLAVKDTSKRNIRILTGVYEKPGLLNFFSAKRQQHVNISHYGLNYADILALAENHLIYQQEGEIALANKGDNIALNYNGINLKLSARKANINVQFYKFTPIGTELAQLISDKTNDEFLEQLKHQFSNHFTIT